MNDTIKLMLRITAVAAFAMALAPPALGQQSTSTSGQSVGRTVSAAERRARDLSERTFNLRMLEKELRRPREETNPQMPLMQIREDFLRLQVVNNDLAKAVSENSALDLKLVAKSTSEIKKRASRLKFNLALPEFKKDAAKIKTDVGPELGQVKSSLSTLDQLVLRFTNNPVFKRADVVDAQLAAKARRDLDEIIELSGGIKKNSEKLLKAAP